MLNNKKILYSSFFLLFFFLFLQPRSLDGDFFHHLNTGKYVVQNYRLPQIDEYTFSAKGQPWVGYGWGMGVIFFLIYSQFENIGISIFIALCGVGTLSLLYFYLKTLKLSEKTRYLTTIIVGIFLSFRFPHRPEILTYPMVISFLFIDALRSKHPKLVLLYPMLILLWANMYGSSAILGLTLLTLFMIRETIQKTLKKNSTLFYISCLISFPISLLNGYGLRTVFYIFFITSVRKIEGEWYGIINTFQHAPIEYLKTFSVVVFLYFIYLSVFIFLLYIQRKNVKKNWFFIHLASSIFLPIFAFRQLQLAVLLTAPAFSLYFEKISIKRFVAPITFVILIVMISIAFLIIPHGVGKIDSENLEMINFLKKHDLSGKTYTNQALGAYLTYYRYPDNLVSYDTRDDLFINNSFVQDLFANKNILMLLDKYQVDVVVMNIDMSPPMRFLYYAENWRVVYIDDSYVVAVPSRTALEKNLPDLEI